MAKLRFQMVSFRKLIPFLLFQAVVGQVMAQSPWKTVESDGIVYFFSLSGNNRIERYEIASSSWKPSISVTPPLGSSLTQAWVDGDGMYLSFNRTLRKYDLDGGGEIHIRNTSTDIRQIISDDQYVFIFYYQGGDPFASSIRKQDWSTAFDQDVGYYSIGGISVDPVNRVFFCRSTSVSPGDIMRLPYLANGSFGVLKDSPHHGEYKVGVETHVFPDGSRVIDDSGTIYDATTLRYVASVAGSFDDIKFRSGGAPIVLRGDTLHRYGANLLEEGRKKLAHTGHALVLDGDDAIVFFDDSGTSRGIGATRVPLADLIPGSPGPPVPTESSLYTPDKVMLGSDGIVYLFSRKYQSIFRWRISTRSYLQSIPLVFQALDVAYSEAHQKIYTAYASGEIRVIDLNTAPLSEVPFFNLPDKPLSIDSVGDFLFAVDPSGAWSTHYVISEAGVLLDSETWRDPSREFEWCEATRKLYFFRDGSSPNDLLQMTIDADGKMGDDTDSPYHGGFNVSTPIRAKPDGSQVIIGSGVIFHGTTLQFEPNSIANSFIDGEWMEDGAFAAIREYQGQVLLEKFTPTFGVADHTLFRGTPLRYFPLDGGSSLVVVVRNEVPGFEILDPELDPVYSSGTGALPPKPSTPTSSSLSSNGVTISWLDNSTSESGFILERKPSYTYPDPGWEVLAVLPANTATFRDSGVTPGSSFQYRVAAFNASGSSGYTAELGVTIPYPTPTAPGYLNLISSTDTSLTIRWPSVDWTSYYRIESRNASGIWSYFASGYDVGDGTGVKILDGLGGGATYTLRVVAVGRNGQNFPPSPVLSATTGSGAPPQTPENFRRGSETSTSISLLWDQSPGANGYRIESLANSVWSVISTITSGSANSGVVSGLLPSTQYTLRISAYNGAGASVPSDPILVTTRLPAGVPGTPTSISLSSRTQVTLTFSWSSVVGATGYRIEREEAGGNWVTALAISGGTATGGTVAGLVPGNTYTFRFFATNSSGASAPSSPVLSTTEPPLTIDADFPVQPDSISDVVGRFVMDWDGAPHTLNGVTAIGAPKGPTGVSFGAPMVKSSLGGLTGRPLVFETSGSTYEQVSMTLGNQADVYNLSLDLLVTGTGGTSTNDGFFLLIDGNNSTRISFESSGNIGYFSNGASGSLGTFAFNQVINLRLQVDVDNGTLHYSLDGGAFADTAIDLVDGDVGSMRISLIDGSFGRGTSAVDNVLITSFTKGAGPVPGRPGTPQLPTISGVTADRVTFGWTDADHLETRFVVQRRTAGGNWTSLPMLAANTVSFTDTGLTGATTYEYRVAALNASGYSAFTSPVTATTLLSIPGKPANFSTISATKTSLNLGWTPSAHAASYRIEKNDGSGNWELFQLVNGGASGSVTVGELEVDAEFVLRIVAINSVGESEPSTTLVTRTAAIGVAGSVAATDGTHADRVVVSWGSVADVSSFEILRNTAASSTGAVSLGVVSGNTFEDRSAASGVSYHYAVRARFGGKTGTLSAWDNGYLTPPAPVTPEFISASLGTSLSRVTVTWTPSIFANFYSVFRSDAPGVPGVFIGTTISPSYIDTLVLPGQVYYYNVMAQNGAGNSPRSEQTPGFASLGNVTGIKVSDYRDDGVLISWTGVVGADNYSVYRSLTNNFNSAELLGLSQGLEYLDTTALIDRRYFYFIVAGNGMATGNVSGALPGIRLSAPGFLPDLMQGASVNNLGGNNHYGRHGASVGSRGVRPVSWIYRAQNDGLLSDSMRFMGGKGDRTFQIDYFGSAGRVTASVVTQGLLMDDIAPEISIDLQMKLTPNRKSKRLSGRRKLVLTKLVSVNDPARQDSNFTIISVR